MDHTIEDFWRMVHQVQPVAVVVVVNPSEIVCMAISERLQAEKRCSEYWPKEAESYKNYGKVGTGRRERGTDVREQ